MDETKGIDRVVQENDAYCNPDTRDCENCGMRDKCLLYLVLRASEVKTLHFENSEKTLKDGKIL